MDDDRTAEDIIRELLERLQEFEWVDRYERCPRGCCRDLVTKCESCDAHEGKLDTPDYRKHKAHCSLAAAMAEATAFLRQAEEAVAAQEASANRPTCWEHIAYG